MIPIFERTRLRLLGQLFQSLSKLIPGRFASISTMFTVWPVDSQEGQQVADPTLSSVTLDFKWALHQFGGVFHDFLQG